MTYIRKKSAILEFRLIRELCVAAIAILVSSQAGAEDDLMKSARQTFKPIPSVVPAVKDNPLTHQRSNSVRCCSSIRESRPAG